MNSLQSDSAHPPPINPVTFLITPLTQDVQEKIASIVKSAEWNDAIVEVVFEWRSDCDCPFDVSVGLEWKLRFRDCAPWQFMHMANIALYAYLPQIIAEESSTRKTAPETNLSQRYARAIRDLALKFSDFEKAWVLGVHEEILGLGANYIRSKMPNSWPTLTWQDFGQMHEELIELRSGESSS